MVEPMGICEKHQLPLDRNGECELCRLSDMPSKAPPARSAWWALIIPLLIAAAGVVWALSWVASEPQDAPQRGVPATLPQPASPQPSAEEPPQPEPMPEAPGPPVPGDEILVPEPGLEGTRLDGTRHEGAATTENGIPDWKWSLARRRVAVTMYATQWCEVCRKAREYMETNRIDFIELDTDENAAAGERLGELNPARTIPTFQIDEEVYIGFREDSFEAKIDQAARKHL